MKHARQRTDRIHGTIYLSSFESELSSTPFFYRLHDIYQSSTVYLTFPSNRTKRYEHSLGTMALASELLFSSITNAEANVRTAFFEALNDDFIILYKKALTKGYHSHYFGNGAGIFEEIVRDSRYGTLAENSEQHVFDKNIDTGIKETIVSYNLLSDDALNHYSMHSSTKNINGNNTNKTGQSVVCSITTERERFIYQCVLQAVRLVALFHDVGHPPFSHIIEDILEKLYEEYKEGSTLWDTGKCQKLQDTLGRFLENNPPVKFYFLNTEAPSVSPHLHERVGIQMFRMAVESIMPDLLNSIKNSCGQGWTAKNKAIVTLYYITSIEFAAAILLEKNNIFRSIHRIIDGIVDADRLDYVVRDSLGSGVDWGTIPYKRLIDSVKLYQIEPNVTNDKTDGKPDLFVIAFPQKVSSDIEDFLVERYKIFARINFHHRCMKTSVALQSAVRTLAKDYLFSPLDLLSPITEPGLEQIDKELCGKISTDDEDDCWTESFPVTISRNIHNLWTALGTTSGDEALKVLQWNDSWMISTLQSALLKIRTEEYFETKFLLQAVRKKWHAVKDSSEWANKAIPVKEAILKAVISEKREELAELSKNLEEFLLNKKSYYSLFKRGIDAKQFIDDVISYAGLSISDIEDQVESEKKKYYSLIDVEHTPPTLMTCLDESSDSTAISVGDAEEAVKRLSRFLEAAKAGDLKRITSIFPPDSESANDIISNVLRESVNNKEILDYKTYINDGREKMGLPPHKGDPTNEIYLYDSSQVYKFDEFISLKPQLKAIEQSVLWLNVYVFPADDCMDTNALLSNLRAKCAEELGKRIRTRYNELFPHHH